MGLISLLYFLHLIDFFYVMFDEVHGFIEVDVFQVDIVFNFVEEEGGYLILVVFKLSGTHP